MPDTKQTGTPDPKPTIAVIGLGYVGMPLALALSKHFKVVGFDLNIERVKALRKYEDTTHECHPEDLAEAFTEERLNVTSNNTLLYQAKVFIVAVPTPVDERNVPDLKCLEAACKTVAKALTKGGLVCFESTVYPGCTEDFCVPIIERESGYKLGQDFAVGYSPERVNPGDKEHRLDNTTKLLAASDQYALTALSQIYSKVAPVHLVMEIKVAEAAKVIENAQRDLNIAFVNELAMMFSKMGIDTKAVLDAACTKWNFLSFRPGLVGGHCIGVDPYYLAHRAQEFDYHTEMILAGRRVNESVAKHIAHRVLKSVRAKSVAPKVLVLGVTFKENCPDTRNSKVVDIIKELREFGCRVGCIDPLVPKECAQEMADVQGMEWDAVILAVPHEHFQVIDFKALQKKQTYIFDVKGVLGSLADERL